MKYSFKTLSVSAGAVALAFAASTASAESVDIKYTNMNPLGGESVNVTGYNGTGGRMNLEVTNVKDSSYTLGQTILAWCVELSQNASTSSHTYTIGSFSGNVATNLTKLFKKYYSLVVDAATSAAMQLAVWEIVSDNGLNLSSGAFTVTSAGGGAETTAQSWLNDLEGGQGNYSVIKLSNGTYQDFVTVAVNEVPLPGAALMFLSALGLGGLARRKQRAAAPEGALAA